MLSFKLALARCSDALDELGCLIVPPFFIVTPLLITFGIG